MIATTVFAGLSVWLTTKIVVESELFTPVRDWVEHRRRHALLPGNFWTVDTRRSRAWRKVGYLLGCHLCAGTWIAALHAAFIPTPYTTVTNSVVAFALAAFTFKAIGHLVLVVEGALDS